MTTIEPKPAVIDSNGENRLLPDREALTEKVDDFFRTLDGLKSGLLVRSIMAKPLCTIDYEDDAEEFFKDPKHEDFDCAPVKHEGRIVGMVYSEDLKQLGASKPIAHRVMRPLSDVRLIAATESVSSLIEHMRSSEEYYWLVLCGPEIGAIVTRSDLWKLPVRMLAVVRILHFEQMIALLITLRDPDSNWLKDLPANSRKRIEADVKKRQAANEHLDPIESTYFSEKLKIVKRLPRWQVMVKRLDGVNDLRNVLMHAKEVDEKVINVTEFLSHLKNLDLAIDEVSKRLCDLCGHEPNAKPSPGQRHH